MSDAEKAVMDFAKTIERHMDYISVNSQRLGSWPTVMAKAFIEQLPEAAKRRCKTCRWWQAPKGFTRYHCSCGHLKHDSYYDFGCTFYEEDSDA